MMNDKVKDNTNEIMAKEKMIIEVDVKTAAKRLITVLLVVFFIVWVAKPEVFRNMMNKKEKKVETNKEIVRIERTEEYTGFLNDGTYVSADDLSEFAEKLSGVTGRVYACEDGKLKQIEGGVIAVVEITVYKR